VDKMVRAAQPSPAADSPPNRVFAATLKAPRRNESQFLELIGSVVASVPADYTPNR